jgi:DNA-binding transcriptional ArsR family regulator
MRVASVSPRGDGPWSERVDHGGGPGPLGGLVRSAGRSAPGLEGREADAAFRARTRASFVRDVIQAPGTGVAITGSDDAESRPDEALSRTHLALADPTRRAILRSLTDGDARVTDLSAPFQMSLAAVSKHIRVLEQPGLVRRTVRGREHLLAFDGRPLRSVSEWIAVQRGEWERRLDTLEELLMERRGGERGR